MFMQPFTYYVTISKSILLTPLEIMFNFEHTCLHISKCPENETCLTTFYCPPLVLYVICDWPLRKYE